MQYFSDLSSYLSTRQQMLSETLTNNKDNKVWDIYKKK